MLTKIDLVRNIGRFAEMKHRAPDFGRLSLLYARNAYGKTTLCSILRSANTANVDLIHERKTLGSNEPSQVTTSWTGIGQVTFNGASWNRKPPRILIFDAEFVRRNIHVGEEVTRDNQRGLLRVIVGAAGVGLTNQINAADDRINEINQALAAKDKTIKLAHPAVQDVGVFCTEVIPVDITNQIEVATRALNAGRRHAEVASRPAPTSLQNDDRLADFQRVLGGAVEGITSDLETRIEDHIARHTLQPQGQRWLRYGTERIKSDECPFCAQDVSSAEFISVLRTYFSEGLKSHVEEIDALAAAIETLLPEGSDVSLRATLAANQSLADFWRSVLEVPPLSSDEVGFVDALIVGLETLRNALLLKRQKPLEEITLAEGEAASVARSISALSNYNRDVAAWGSKIEAAKANSEPPNIPALTKAHGYLTALAARETGELAVIVRERTQLEAEKAALVSQKSAAKENLSNHLKTTAAAHENVINNLLKLFGATFSLCQTKASFVGRDPNTEYCIDVGGHIVKAGASAKGPAPTFKTLLSAGDKSTLALAFFISGVLSDPLLKDSVIVFDDPFNSQDYARQIETGRQIRMLATKAEQVIVLSHDLRFVQKIYKDADKTQTTVRRLICDAPGVASIRVCDPEKELQVLYVRRADRIRLYAKTGIAPEDCTLTEIQSDLRTFMEEYVDLRNPGRFTPLTMLDAMVDAIESHGEDDPLYPHREDLRAINEFSRPDHHKGADIPDPDQLRAKCQQVLSVIGSY